MSQNSCKKKRFSLMAIFFLKRWNILMCLFEEWRRFTLYINLKLIEAIKSLLREYYSCSKFYKRINFSRKVEIYIATREKDKNKTNLPIWKRHDLCVCKSKKYQNSTFPKNKPKINMSHCKTNLGWKHTTGNKRQIYYGSIISLV